MTEACNTPESSHSASSTSRGNQVTSATLINSREATAHGDVTFGVHKPGVASVKPAVAQRLGRLFRSSPIGFHEAAAQADLADLANPEPRGRRHRRSARPCQAKAAQPHPIADQVRVLERHPILQHGVAGLSQHFSSAATVVVADEGLESWRQTYRIISAHESWRIHGEWVEKHFDAPHRLAALARPPAPKAEPRCCLLPPAGAGAGEFPAVTRVPDLSATIAERFMFAKSVGVLRGGGSDRSLLNVVEHFCWKLRKRRSKTNGKTTLRSAPRADWAVQKKFLLLCETALLLKN